MLQRKQPVVAVQMQKQKCLTGFYEATLKYVNVNGFIIDIFKWINKYLLQCLSFTF